MLVAKNPPAKAADETQAPSLGQEDPLEKEMATHSSILAWEIPRTEEPGRLQSMGLQSRTRLSTHTHDMMCTVHACIPLSSQQPNKGTALVIPTLQMRKLKPKEAQ